MKTLECKNCGGKIETEKITEKYQVYYIGCPSCRQNVVYGWSELEEYTVDEPTHDTVHEPSHYNQGKIKVADYAEQVVAHYTPVEAPHIYNAIKYISRAPHKGTKDADIDKAINSLIRAKTGEWKE